MSFRELLHLIESARSTRELKHRVIDNAAATLGAGALGLYLLDDEGNLAEVYARGVRDKFIFVYEQMGRGHDPILERAMTTLSAAHDRSVYTGDSWTRSPLYRECGGPWQIEHYLCVPVAVGGRIVGTLNLGRGSPAHPFGARDAARATALSRRIGGRLEVLASDRDEPAARGQPTLEQLGRWRAGRVRVRLHAGRLEASTPQLPADEAAALWDAVVAHQLAPIDEFHDGERRYLLLPSPQVAPSASADSLSPREREVVQRVAAGMANKEIAFELAISVHTVATLVRTARGKLAAGSRVQLIQIARRLGLAS